ncbi:MAG: group II intron maturase-specific domain-containing protein, partial [Thermodesulfobacteriota bacterium]|nr:group II intron maturase-specific domain-containing protein [Thermodesulfobacteriota bacterium]
TEEGTPQGGPLSPLLSNIVPDELDKELERRGLRFARYADDFILNQYLRGWWNYYRITQGISMFCSINGWIMRRLRAICCKQWKNPGTRVRELKKRGVFHRYAVTTGNARKGPWRMSRVKWVIIALKNAYFRRTLGLFLPGLHLLPDQPNRLST